MRKNLAFLYSRLSEKLWFRPFLFCLLSVAAALISRFTEFTPLADLAPLIEKDSLEDLLTTISASMLVIAIFAVGAMLSAFSSAAGTATPRSFNLIVADDVSQNALSIFIGSFIYSIVASVALKNGFYTEAGYFALFVITLAVFWLVIITFLRWVQRISKLGRLSYTIRKVEDATARVILNRLQEPLLGGIAIRDGQPGKGRAVYGDQAGYVQHINMDQLQSLAGTAECTIQLQCLPGSFVYPDRPLALVFPGQGEAEVDEGQVRTAFVVDHERSFHDDPRFGLIALTEIASRALSPGINDPGTAIAIINSHVRLFHLWFGHGDRPEVREPVYDRITVPAMNPADIFADAFRPIARDGAGNIEVMIWLQKALASIAATSSPAIAEMARREAAAALLRATGAMDFKPDIDLLRTQA